MWAARSAALELHPLLARAGAAERADALVLDLDPVPPAGLRDCARLALGLRDRLGRAGLAAVPKISGGRGLHLHVPLEEDATFARTKAYARALAADLARADPDRVTDRMPLVERAGKVLVDWRQNDPNRSMIAPWSLRA